MKETLKSKPKYEHELSIQSLDDMIKENKNYWLNSFNKPTWDEFVSSGGRIVGFREKRWERVKKIKYGDYFLCYVSGFSGFISILKAVSKPYFDKDNLISKIDLFPARISVEILVQLKPENAVSISDLKDISLFNDLKNKRSSDIVNKGSPKLLKKEEGAMIARSIIQKRDI